METGHEPVLPDEVLRALNVQPGGIYVDCTAGRGGHSGIILNLLGPNGCLLVLDRDPEAFEFLHRRFAQDRRVRCRHSTYAALESLCRESGVHGDVAGVLLDLGASSPQFDQGARGFSFQNDGPLDMRYDTTTGVTAADWLQSAPEAEISEVLHRLGEERFARRIARAIVGARASGPVTTTHRLRDIIAAAVPTRERDRHPATRSFQAIRIFVNGELEALTAVLPQAVAVLRTGGRLAVISFHSLEDRIVKRFLRTEARGDPHAPEMPVRAADLKPRLRLIGAAQRPAAAEVARNPRARSAVLRVAERTAA
ncbi:MAG: 16S rRNA (cytosine(1402)-N(4))-methyltransferase RsmH [Gammaproteobacteria bacterium]|nr:16S rRNA (cytosine(1402)-N(4))-methyltransferase RsmH [Gammaproteobacteria bacterium]